MTDDPREPETQPAQPGPAAGEATVLRNYWEEAYKGLDEKAKARVRKLEQTFDEDTKKAIKKLLNKAKPDPEATRKLQDIEKNYLRLDVRGKGTLQRLSQNARKKVDDEAIVSISNIHEACMEDSNRNVGEGDQHSVSADELLQLCRERQELAKQKRWDFEFLGKRYVVHEVWGTVVDKIDKCKPAIDLATSSEPTANIGWSVVKVVLQIAVQGEKEAGAILTGIDTAVSTMQRCTVYDNQVQEITRENAKGQTHIQAFESCLISTYSRILTFFSEAAVCLEKSQPGIYWHAFWSAGDIVSFANEIFKLEQKMFQDSAIGSFIKQEAMTMQVLDRLTMVQDDMKQLREALLRDTVDQNLKAQLEAREDMLCWWSSSKVEDHHKAPKDLRAADTGRWVFKKKEYVCWSMADGPRILWIKGIPGAGKTVLMSRIIDRHLKSREKASDIDYFQLAYFYCKSDAPERRFSHNIFRSFIRQLADRHYPLPEQMCAIYRDKGRPSSLSTVLSHEEYYRLFLQLIPTTIETILILDALDECIGDEKQPLDSNEEMKPVLSMFQKLLESGLPVKLIVSSRYDSDIEAMLGSQDMIEISSADNRDDIFKMVQENIHAYNNKVKKHNEKVERHNQKPRTSKMEPKPKINRELRDKMLQVFAEKSEGKFQWASMHIKYLLTGALTGPGEMERELGKLPPDLTEAYHKFFERIRLQSGSKPETAFRVFRWLLASKGSCYKDPLIAATCQRLEGDKPDTVEADEAYVLTACQNLVISDGSVFRFSHMSVQEYCEKHQSKLTENCHFDVALVCVWMIFRYNTRDQAIQMWMQYHKAHRAFPGVHDEQTKLDKLWEFAANGWYNHFREIEDERQKSEIREIVLKSFASDALSVDSTAWLRLQAAKVIHEWKKPISRVSKSNLIMLPLQPRNWVNPFVPNSTNFAFPGALVAIQAIVAGVMWKARHSLHGYLAGEVWSEYDRDVRRTQQQGYFESQGDCLQSSLNKRLRLVDYQVQSEEIMVLLKMLFLFEKHQNEEKYQDKIRKRLLEEKDVVNKWLQEEEDKQRERLWELRGLKRIFEEMIGEPSCHEFLGELARLTLLLLANRDWGWDIDTSYRREFVEYLLRTFPNASRIEYRHLIPVVEFLDLSSVLVHEAGSLEKRLLEILISHGANVNAVRLKTTPLITAVTHNRVENVQTLLQKGAYVNMVCQGGTHRTALIAGCAVGDIKVLEVLLDTQDIEIDAVAGADGCNTALIAACQNCRAKVVKILLKKDTPGLRETVRGRPYVDALFAAADSRCIRAVGLLLKSPESRVSEAARRRWRHYRTSNLRVGDLKNHDSVLGNLEMICSLLVALLIREQLRSILDDEDDDEQAFSDESDNDGVKRVESDNRENDSEEDSEDDNKDDNKDDSDRSDTSRDSSDEGDKYDDSDEDDDGNNGNSHHQDTMNEDHSADASTDEDVSNQGAGIDEPTDDNRNPAESFATIIKLLNRSVLLDSQKTGETLLQAFGFDSYEHRQDLVKGFQKLVWKTEKKDWHIVVDAWLEFLDLAEEAEEERRFSPLLEQLSKGVVTTVSRADSFSDLEPYPDEDDWEDE